LGTCARCACRQPQSP